MHCAIGMMRPIALKRSKADSLSEIEVLVSRKRKKKARITAK